MAGRPRVYGSAAEKTKAYRQREAARLTFVDRVSQEQLEAQLKRLVFAVVAARQAGDALAQRLDTITVLDLLSDLAAYFEEGGNSAQAD